MEPINYRSLLTLIERIKDISVNQLENNDLEWAENYNHNLVSVAGFSLNKKIKLTVIRPDVSINIKLTDFDMDVIKEIIKKGYEKAYTVVNT
jgi:NTE family protein